MEAKLRHRIFTRVFFGILLSGIPVASHSQNPAPQNAADNLAPLVVLSYPVEISKAAQPRMKLAFESPFELRDYARQCGDCVPSPNALENSLSKTQFYFMEFYSELAKVLPPRSIVIQPAMVDVGEDGKLIYKVWDQELPANLRVDFMVYAMPLVVMRRLSWHNTIGRFVTPLIAVTVPDSSLEGKRYLVTTEHLLFKSNGVQPSVLIQIFNNSRLNIAQAITDKSVTTLKLKEMAISEADWASQINGSQAIESRSLSVMKPYVQAVSSAFQSTNGRSISAVELQAYRSIFTNELAAAGPGGEVLIPKFISAEREFVQKVNLGFIAKLDQGDFGETMRQRLIAERSYHEQQAKSNLLYSFAALAGGLSNMSSGRPVGENFAAEEEAHQETSSQHFATYSASASGLTNEQFRFVVTVGQKEEVVVGNSVQALRDGFKNILLNIAKKRSR